MPLADARVSEAHAMISLREGRLQIIALRGGLALAGEAVQAVTLAPGQQIQLARGVDISVADVTLPEHVLGIEGIGPLPMMLPAVASLVADPQPRLVRGWRDGAEAWIWNAGERFWWRAAGGSTSPVELTTVIRIGNITASFLWMPTDDAGPTATRYRPDTPLTVVSHFDVVHIYRGGTCALVLGGQPARIIAELASSPSPLAWSEVARLLWPDAIDEPALLRARFDVVVARLRRKLRAAGIRPDLLATDGSGHLGLILHEHDRVEDRA